MADDAGTTWDDHTLVPTVSSFRTHVLGFLDEADKARMSLVSEQWYDGAAEWDAWAPDYGAAVGVAGSAIPLGCPCADIVATGGIMAAPDAVLVVGSSSAIPANRDANAATAAAGAAGQPPPPPEFDKFFGPQQLPFPLAKVRFPSSIVLRRGDFGVPYRFTSPTMFGLVIAAAGEIDRYFGKTTPPPDIVGLGQLLSESRVRYLVQYPALHVLLRMPQCLLSSANTDDPTLPPGYHPLPAWHVMLLHAARWHELTPTYANIPWLVSLAWWAAENRDPCTGAALPFTKALAAPMLAVATSKAARLTRVRYFWALVDATVCAVKRYWATELHAAEARMHLRATLFAALQRGGGQSIGTTRLKRRQWLQLRMDERRYARPPVILAAYTAHWVSRSVGTDESERQRDDDNDDDVEDDDDLRTHPDWGFQEDAGHEDTFIAFPPNAEPAAVREIVNGQTTRRVVEVLGDDDPRLLFSVLAYLRGNYVKMADGLDSRVRAALGPVGVLECAVAEARIALLRRAAETHEEAELVTCSTSRRSAKT